MIKLARNALLWSIGLQAYLVASVAANADPLLTPLIIAAGASAQAAAVIVPVVAPIGTFCAAALFNAKADEETYDRRECHQDE